jgi:hypothetical protein
MALTLKLKIYGSVNLSADLLQLSIRAAAL